MTDSGSYSPIKDKYIDFLTIVLKVGIIGKVFRNLGSQITIKKVHQNNYREIFIEETNESYIMPVGT